MMESTAAKAGSVYTLQISSTPDVAYHKKATFASLDAALDSAFTTLSADFAPKDNWQNSWRLTDSDSGDEWRAAARREHEVAVAPHKCYAIITSTSTTRVFTLSDARGVLGVIREWPVRFSVLERGCSCTAPLESPFHTWQDGRCAKISICVTSVHAHCMRLL